ncbi:methyl-accepting chemotaxis protein [Oceanispirochaeta crateris]|uniref:Methyl-accepting chemotaxis protein n=1 Tax=Oceanispirochaeta crateris TaxID=2518645 RepID=A0A5C1QN58_9SPIO|nr:methyl-accepting chemotaxis protein [Oceanispirochaeta crateris]QEN08967.1 methyl-accepting chemotaxis protein [Oceanispirochaeta crateris]
MKISMRIVLSGSIILFLSLLGFGVGSKITASNILESQINSTLKIQVEMSARLVENYIEQNLSILTELAMRESTKSMDFNVQDKNLTPDIERLGFLGLGIVSKDGQTRYIDSDTTADLSDRDYVKRAFNGEANMSDVIISKVTNSSVIMFAAPIFVEGVVQQVLIARADGNHLSVITNSLGYGQHGYAYLLNTSGIVTAHSNKEFVINQFDPINESKSNPDLKSLATAFEAMIQTKIGLQHYSFNGKNIINGYHPVKGSPFIISIVAIQDEFFAPMQTLTNLFIALAVVILTLSILGFLFIGKTLSRPIIQTAMILKEISEGAGDLTERIDISSKDEIGDMARYFNLTLEKIRRTVLQVKNQSQLLKDAGVNLSSNMVETAAAINEITANIQSIKTQTVNQSASVTETSATMEQITKGIEKLNQLIEDQSANVTESSSAIEEMMANIGNVTHTLVNNSENIKRLTDSSEDGKHLLDGISFSIKDVAKESEGLLEISQIIQHIASQTNLLSMNAAIEAAHAGESGKGFAVVADEIRKLAELSSAQTKTIDKALKNIINSITGVTHSSEEVLSKFTIIEEEVKTVGEQETSIRMAMEEQTEGSKQVLEAIMMLNDITQKVQMSSEEMLSGSKQVLMESKNMNDITQEIASGMNEMASGTDQVTVAVNQVNELSTENNTSIEALIGEVNKFKV